MAACVNCQGRACTNSEANAISKTSTEDDEQSESHDLPDVLFDDEIDWLDEETINEVNSVSRS